MKSGSEAHTGFSKVGHGLLWVWICHIWASHSWTYHVVRGQNTSEQNAGGQNASQNCKGGQNTGHFWDKMPILTKHLIYRASKKSL